MKVQNEMTTKITVDTVQAAESGGGKEGHARGLVSEYRRRRAHNFGDQPRSFPHGRKRLLPRGPLLSPQRAAAVRAGAERQKRGHPAHILLDGRADERQPQAESGSGGNAAALWLAGQRAGAAQRGRISRQQGQKIH